MEENGMTNQQLDEYIEMIAQLIEANAKTIEEAAEIVRSAKIAKDAKPKK